MAIFGTFVKKSANCCQNQSKYWFSDPVSNVILNQYKTFNPVKPNMNIFLKLLVQLIMGLKPKTGQSYGTITKGVCTLLKFVEKTSSNLNACPILLRSYSTTQKH